MQNNQERHDYTQPDALNMQTPPNKPEQTPLSKPVKKQYGLLFVLSAIISFCLNAYFHGISNNLPYFIGSSLGSGLALFLIPVIFMKYKSNRAAFIALAIVALITAQGQKANTTRHTPQQMTNSTR